MIEEKPKLQPISPLKFRSQILLYFLSATFWEPFYNWILFKKLNELDRIPRPNGVPSTRNSVIINVLLVISIVGAPLAYFKRYNLLRDYIIAMEPFLSRPPKQVNKEGLEVEGIRANCIEGKKFVWYSFFTFFSIVVLITCFSISIFYLLQYSTIQELTNNLWLDGAFMIFFLIGINTFFICGGFVARVIIEERNWFKAFNAISSEIMLLNKIQLQEKMDAKN